MVNQVNDIAWQAHQGSVAAIIQVLNEKLANSGVRTRAIFDNGILQLLCEAPSREQLEQSSLVDRVQHILESIAPRNIRRVNINSRIVREQQLLWLEEINRDPENQVLWSQEISLAKPNKIKQFIKYFGEVKAEYKQPKLPKYQYSQVLRITNNQRHTRIFSTRIKIGFSLLSITIIAWFTHSLLGTEQKHLTLKDAKFSNSIQSWKAHLYHSPIVSRRPKPITNNLNNSKVAYPVKDPFTNAIRIANKTTSAAKTAKTPAQWSEIAKHWRKASELMSTVPENHSSYKLAQNRTELYKKYSQIAEKEATKK
ncbi:hypothetical protein [Mastigocoleus testarum]|uniref:Uncharacterized protein n=1 Tax=Mastigocoleus testarum BC008 TaxID=371196 RepID=A0A0V7ZBC9_9CYAN|nr:hypothetical protein [Mastigocoleus testarum]KST61812.1 hypothetical protein BC008_07175 [Mastigocoleus testarum BC008]